MFADKEFDLDGHYQFVYDGTVIASSMDELRNWIEDNCEEQFEDYISHNFANFELNTVDMDPAEVLGNLGTFAYQEEMEYWIENIVIHDASELKELGIDVVEILPPEERVYRIEPICEPWEVKGSDMDYDWYGENVKFLEVGETTENEGYRITRTKNKRPFRGVFR